MGKIVEYDSKMNELNFGKFKEKEMDLFFSICYKMKNEGLNEVTLTFQELKELSNYSNRNLDRFIKDLESTYDKMLNIKIRTETKTTITKIILFTRYHIEKEDRTVRIKMHEDGKYLLNDIEKFTKFDLMEFVSLKSSYAKNMFKMLKQFDNEDSYNWYQIKIDDFKIMLDVPKSYKMSHIDSFVLSPILEQLKPCFNGLKLEKIKKGVKVDSLKFTWKAKKKKQVEEIQAIKKRSSIGERELEQHLKQFEKVEENNGLKIQEIKKEINQMDQVEKIKISKVDYKELYKKYLEENNIKHSISVRKIFDTMNKSKYEIVEFETKEYIQTKIYTVEDIDESLLVSKNGRKLVGMAKQHKIKKILEEMNS
ncbi:replication initiation protein [Cetobacterium somerae]|nr:replication initiation protein [Cetobacterium somerae]